ncbi:MAG: lipopolysaccharide biosynthesis, partial [Oscillospiraceae bacterium]|nr:lipopolysaccharide biosynthesis [Oscillospiraceae bacterium]
MNNIYSIKNLIMLFLGKIWIIIAVTFCGGIAAFCVSRFILPLEYSSHISMYAQSYTEVKGDSAQNYNDISKSKQLINTYI